MQIIVIVAVHSGVRRSRVEVRRFDNADRAPLRYARRRYVLPRGAPILRQLYVPVIRSRPNYTFLDLPPRDCQDRSPRLLLIFFIHPPAPQGRPPPPPPPFPIRPFP